MGLVRIFCWPEMSMQESAWEVAVGFTPLRSRGNSFVLRQALNCKVALTEAYTGLRETLELGWPFILVLLGARLPGLHIPILPVTA